MAYTLQDSPTLKARIDADLAHIVDVVRRADPRLRSLVLTGGFSRGEGTVLNGEPQNDYDLVAIRGVGGSRSTYQRLESDLSSRLGLHIDLSPVAALRLRWVSRSIFWYETALRGRTLWGEPLLAKIPIRSPDDIDPSEGLRLLVNRAAGLLLATSTRDAHATRIQAAKALLASLDSDLLSLGRFPPTQRERWEQLQTLQGDGRLPPTMAKSLPWMQWAYHFKTQPATAPPVDADEAWQSARTALLACVPGALHHAGLPSLEAYGRRDGVLDRLVFLRRSRSVPGARPLARHPTGRVRVATLRLLESSPDGRVRPQEVERWLGPVARTDHEPLRLLDALRRATLQ